MSPSDKTRQQLLDELQEAEETLRATRMHFCFLLDDERFFVPLYFRTAERCALGRLLICSLRQAVAGKEVAYENRHGNRYTMEQPIVCMFLATNIYSDMFYGKMKNYCDLGNHRILLPA